MHINISVIIITKIVFKCNVNTSVSIKIIRSEWRSIITVVAPAGTLYYTIHTAAHI